jgi:pimeloyl-ACP methyl ester carboxylesterase
MDYRLKKMFFTPLFWHICTRLVYDLGGTFILINLSMEKVTSKDGTVIAYNRAGAGYPLIMVDGAFCSSIMGPSIEGVPLFAQHFDVISYDRRGRNESGDTKPYAVEREIEDLDALIGVAGGAAYVFGHSSGAALALSATAAGLNITKLALYEPPYNAGNDKIIPADAEEQLKTMIAADKRSDAVKFFLKDLIGIPAIVVFIMRLLPVWKKLKAIAHTTPYDIAILDNFKFPFEKAASIKIPVFLSGGDKSQVMLQHSVQKLAEVMPNSTLKILKGQDHSASMKVIAPVVIEFLK